MEFMLTLAHYLEHRSISIRERIDFTTMALDVIYGKLKTYEMKQDKQTGFVYWHLQKPLHLWSMNPKLLKLRVKP